MRTTRPHLTIDPTAAYGIDSEPEVTVVPAYPVAAPDDEDRRVTSIVHFDGTHDSLDLWTVAVADEFTSVDERPHAVVTDRSLYSRRPHGAITAAVSRLETMGYPVTAIGTRCPVARVEEARVPAPIDAALSALNAEIADTEAEIAELTSRLSATAGVTHAEQLRHIILRHEALQAARFSLDPSVSSKMIQTLGSVLGIEKQPVEPEDRSGWDRFQVLSTVVAKQALNMATQFSRDGFAELWVINLISQALSETS